MEYVLSHLTSSTENGYPELIPLPQSPKAVSQAPKVCHINSHWISSCIIWVFRFITCLHIIFLIVIKTREVKRKTAIIQMTHVMISSWATTGQACVVFWMAWRLRCMSSHLQWSLDSIEREGKARPLIATICWVRKRTIKRDRSK